MKRLLLGLPVLLILVSAGLFAFKGINKAATDKFIFYEVVNDQVNPAAPLNDVPMTKAEFQASGLSPCEEGYRVDCVRGWKLGITPTSTGAGQEVIQKK
jgi:hypothetical protein